MVLPLQQPWYYHYNTHGASVTTAVERLGQLYHHLSSDYLIVIHTNPSMFILYISGCGDLTLDMNISIYIGRYMMRSTTRRLSLHYTSAHFFFFSYKCNFSKVFCPCFCNFSNFYAVRKVDLHWQLQGEDGLLKRCGCHCDSTAV